MTGTGIERRRLPRENVDPQVIRLQLVDPFGNPKWVTADLVDISDGGIGISMLTPLARSSKIVVRGEFGASPGLVSPATVRWCIDKTNGNYRVGLEFEDGSSARHSSAHSAAIPLPEELDHYETMQLSPNADEDTIQRVYRALAQRYHPDSLHTGNTEMFIRLTEAYKVLINPELRAQYDVRYRETKRLNWKIFDQAEATRGPEAELRKRRGILELLYAKSLHDPGRATMTVLDFEQLLDCPRQHLEAALWYLKGKSYVQRGDSGRFSITIQGFDAVESVEAPPANRGLHLLTPAY